MAKFKIQQKNTGKPIVINAIKVTSEQNEKLLKIAKKAGLKRAEIARQMIVHCLNEYEI